MIAFGKQLLAGASLRRRVRAIQSAIVLGTWALLALVLRPLPSWTPPVLEAAATQPQAAPAPVSPLDLAVLWTRNLRQPPVDPPPAAAPPPIPETPLAIRLVGTAVEAERSFAVFALADNRTLVREIGGHIEGYELIAVQRGSARLRRGEREYELRVPWFERIAAETAQGAGAGS